MTFPSTVQIDPGSVVGTAPDGTPLVSTSQPVFDGLSSISGFKNATRITIVDVTDPSNSNPPVIGGFDRSDLATNVAANWTDASGRFSIQVRPGFLTTVGLKKIEIYATDDAGAIGNKVSLSFTFSPQKPTSAEHSR